MSPETARKERADIWDSLFAALEVFLQIYDRNLRVVLAEPHCANGRPPVALAVSLPLHTLGAGFCAAPKLAKAKP